MLSNALAFIAYAVRAVGLLIVVISSLAVAWFSMFGEKHSVAAAVCSALVLAAAVLSWPRVPKAWRRDPPTEKQLEYALKLGIDIPDGCSKGQLSDMISAAKAARDSF